MFISWAVTSNKIRGDSDSLIFVIVMWNLSYLVKLLLYTSVGAFSFLYQCPCCCWTQIFVQKLVKLLFIEFIWTIWSVSLRKQLPFFNLPYQSRAVLPAMITRTGKLMPIQLYWNNQGVFVSALLTKETTCTRWTYCTKMYWYILNLL